MNIQLQQTGHRESRYERPNQTWVCGWAADGRPCTLGPDRRGRCPARAEAECAPRRDGDRYHCTRLDAFGGACEPGPLPDGSCCGPEPEHPVCQPRLSIRALRGRLNLAVFIGAIGALLVGIAGPWRLEVVSPGELASVHRAFERPSDAPNDCAVCHVATGKPAPLDALEPINTGLAVAEMGLAHVVITSVDRDDLDDGGAGHFAAVIGALRAAAPDTTVEVLTPDFLGKPGAIETVVEAAPDVFNHNLETVPRLYATIRPGARYFTSLELLHRVKRLDPAMFTKSGMMVGLGESDAEVHQVMDDLRAANVDFLTIGQYLQPTPRHATVARFVTPDEFAGLEKMAYGKGFLLVSASPLTRSSYFAGDDFARLRAAREDRLGAAREDRLGAARGDRLDAQ